MSEQNEQPVKDRPRGLDGEPMLYREELAELKCPDPTCNCGGAKTLKCELCGSKDQMSVVGLPEGVVKVICSHCDILLVTIAVASRTSGN